MSYFNKSFAYKKHNALLPFSCLQYVFNCFWHQANQTNDRSHLKIFSSFFRKKKETPTQIVIMTDNTCAKNVETHAWMSPCASLYTVYKINFILFHFNFEEHESRATSNSMFFIQISIFTRNFNWFSCPNTILYTHSQSCFIVSCWLIHTYAVVCFNCVTW